jgi:hypothetical protein
MNVTVEWLAHLLGIVKAPGLILGQNTSNIDGGISLFSSVPAEHFRIVSEIKPLSIPFTCFPIHYLPLPLSATYMNLDVETSLHEPRLNEIIETN